MSEEERRSRALKAAPAVRDALGYIDIDRYDSDETWADMILAVLEHMADDE
jgi:hypothetical protein